MSVGWLQVAFEGRRDGSWVAGRFLDVTPASGWDDRRMVLRLQGRGTAASRFVFWAEENIDVRTREVYKRGAGVAAELAVLKPRAGEEVWVRYREARRGGPPEAMQIGVWRSGRGPRVDPLSGDAG